MNLYMVGMLTAELDGGHSCPLSSFRQAFHTEQHDLQSMLGSHDFFVIMFFRFFVMLGAHAICFFSN